MAEPATDFRSAWEFSRAEELWERFSPLTPYGKDEKEERRVHADGSRLEELYDGTEAALAILRSLGALELDMLSYRLRRLPRLPFEEGSDTSALDVVGLFLVKKFLANYRAVLSLLDAGTRERFGLSFGSAALAAQLDRGGSDPESFAVAECYDPELPALRDAIARTDDVISASRAASREAAMRERGLDFGSRDFLILPHAQAASLLQGGGSPSCAFSVEAYDGASCLVRIQSAESELLLEEERESLAARERAVESAVVSRLSALVAAEAARLSGYARAICAFDLARARAAMAIELDLVRPVLRRPDPADPAAGPPPLLVEGGRYLPCAWDCERRGTAYAPLDAELRRKSTAVFGSNMGGKTVALKTIAFLQVLAQAGLFVPARRFASSVYASVSCLGEGLRAGSPEGRPRGAHQVPPEGDDGGLSGFGFEIRAFAEAWERALRGPSLVIMDEFARTTGSSEAEAILSAVLDALSALRGARCLLATHFRGIDRSPGAEYLRMRGLDREAARSAMGSEEPLPERVRRINGMMRYELVRDEEGEGGGSDALAVAELLGLDGGIARDAEKRWEERK